MVYLITAFLVSLVLTVLLIRYQNLHSRYSADTDLTGVQKYHVVPVPRVGGVALAAGVLLVCVPVAFREPDILVPMLLLWACALPAFLGGVIEDLTKKVSVRARLVCMAASGALLYFVLGAAISRLNILGLDWLLSFGVVAFVATLVAIAGAANAINIIDGYNGLAAVVSGLIFAGFAYVSYYLDDRFLLVTCVSMMGAIGGFLIWNYPRGMIFLGDGGAYFIGFMMGAVSILLLARHPNVSAWFPLLLCFYPVFETLFSIYRKGFLRRQSPGMPDGVHLHMLIYKRLVRWAEAGPRAGRVQTQRNALTSSYLWVLSSLASVPAVLFWKSEPLLIGFTVLFSVSYVLVYRALVLFKMPRWLVLKKRK